MGESGCSRVDCAASRDYYNYFSNGLASATVTHTRAMDKYLFDIARKEIPAPDINAPKTILNKSVGPHRVFDAVQFPLAGFKESTFT